MSTKKLSIIIPCYNIEKYIARCLESILPQLNDSVEVVVINDGSTDSSRAILSELEAKYPDAFSVADFMNGGLATARNRGIDITSGEYLWFIDGDDFISENAVSVLLDEINESNARIIAFNHAEHTDGGILRIPNYSRSEISVSQFLRLGSRHFAWNRIYHRSVFKEVRFVDGLRNIEDFVFNLSVSPFVNKVVTLDDSLYVYECTNVSSISRDRSLRHLIQLTQETFKAHAILAKRHVDVTDPELKRVWTEQLTTTYAGHIFSLLRFYNCRMVKRAIETYRQWGVYPFPYTGNYRQNIFSFVVNHRETWPMFNRLKRFLIK